MATPLEYQAGMKNIDWADGRKVLKLSNVSKIYWPDEGYTKGEMLKYYEQAAPYILPYLKNRALSLKRNPNGIRDEGFYHKNAGEDSPSWVKVEKIYSEASERIIHYLVCNDLATLLYIANLGSIEINPWNSRIKSPDKPDYMSLILIRLILIPLSK